MMSKNNEKASKPLKYKKLKKQLKASFKQIRQALKKESPLEAELVQTFCTQARLMATYPDKGSEYYPAFLNLIERFALAAEAANDPTKLAETVAAIERMKKSCHKRYK